MKQVKSIALKELEAMAERMYGTLVKAVVDIEDKHVVVDAEMHVDEEQFLLEQGSKQSNLWGLNLYPSKYGTDEFIEYDSMINIRPSAKNLSRYIEDEATRNKIADIISGVVKK